jgi:pyruvate dehydrogenase E2 component (dihydrolipoamide acetyltransferase)
MANDITIPRLGWSMEEGTFVRWLKQEGDWVNKGDLLFELESDKALQEIESIDEGVLRIDAGGPASGQVLPVGQTIGRLLSKAEAAAPAGAPSTKAAAPITPPAGATPGETPPPMTSPGVATPSVRRLARQRGVDLQSIAGSGLGGRVLPEDIELTATSTHHRGSHGDPGLPPISTAPHRHRASPRARRVAADLGLDVSALNGSGRNGRVRERDVRQAAATETAATSRDDSAAPSGRAIPISSRRRTIAQRMLASSHQTAPVTLTTRADATNLVGLREQFKAASHAPVPAYTDIVARLTALVLLEHPALAGRWRDDHIELPADNGWHIGIAMDTDEGLLVPVLREVDRRTLTEIASESRRLLDQARSGRLAAADMQGGVFTITNLGAYGIEGFTPIINAPQTAILGLGAIRLEPVVLPDGRIVPRDQLTLSLTFDHRAIDGAPAARFLQALSGAIANPSAWLLR